MPKATTNETTTEPAGLVALRDKITKMEADAAAAHAEEQRLAAEAEQLKEAARVQHAEREKLEREIQQAERQAIDEQRKILPPRVTRAIAADVAETLLRAFDNANADGDAKPADQHAAQLWQTIDDCRCQLLTPEVDQDAFQIVLATEGAIEAVDAWEQARRPEADGARAADGEPLADIRWQTTPNASSVVRGLLVELRRVLNGEEATPIESIGTLIGQNVGMNQICRMHNLLLPDGSPDVDGLGVLVDRALGTVGFYREVNPWSHLKRLGAMNSADAWALRSMSLEARRKASHALPGAAQRAGTIRLGRLSSFPADVEPTNQPLHVSDPKFRFFHRSKMAAEAEAQEGAAGKPLSPGQVRDGLRAQMSRRQ